MALPDRVYAHASPASIGGRSLFSAGHRIHYKNVWRFRSLPPVLQVAKARLEEAGFEVLQATPTTINFAGSPDQFEKAFRTKIVEKEVERPNGPTTTFLDSPDTDITGLISSDATPFEKLIEGVALEVPRSFFAPDAAPPAVNYFHLRVPGDIAARTNATLAHSSGVTGAGIRVAFVDSGWYRHPHFVAQGYNVAPVVLAPGATLPDNDESGHGTGESANLLAVAPGCQLMPVKMNFVNTIAAFNTAVALRPHVISCSWGSHSPFFLSAADMVLAASVAEAVASGITVVFSAGNGHAGFPGQHPDVISAGGTFMDENGSLQASNYSSAFMSQVYPDRRVPDVCGLVGMRPKAIYIMLPVEPGDNIDTGNSGSFFPDGDETAADDGWAVFSGTSAAAPQIAGTAALIKQVAPNLSPAGVKFALMGTCRDVVQGMCSPVPGLHGGLPAALGPDDATGWGLIDSFWAVVAGYYLSTVPGLQGAPVPGGMNTSAADGPAVSNLAAMYGYAAPYYCGSY